MHRNQIMEDLNYVMEKKRYSGKMRDFEKTSGKVMKYGLVTILSGGSFIVPYAVYRLLTDKCRKTCGTNQVCYNTCYYNASKKVSGKIQEEIKRANSNKEYTPEKKNRKIKALRKELSKWEIRASKYKEKISMSQMN